MRVFLPQYFEKTWTFVGHYYYHYHQCSSPVGHSPPSSLDYAQTTTDDEKFFYLHSPWCWLSQLSVRSPPMSMSSSCQGAYALLLFLFIQRVCQSKQGHFLLSQFQQMNICLSVKLLVFVFYEPKTDCCDRRRSKEIFLMK